MRLNIIFYLTFIFLCVGFSTKSQDFESDSIHVLALEFEQKAYFDTDDEQKARHCLQASDFYLAKHDFVRSEACLKQLNLNDVQDSLAATVRYRLAISAFMAGNMVASEGYLIQQSVFNDSIFKDDFRALYILSLNEQLKWQEAKIKSLAWINEHTLLNPSQKDSLSQIVKQVYSEINVPKLKKEKAARIYAQFIPGGSYFYTSYWKDGMVNAGLQTFFLGVTAYGIYSHYYVTALVIGYGFFQRFYTGAIKKHATLVKDRNKQLSFTFNEKSKKDILLIKKDLQR